MRAATAVRVVLVGVALALVVRGFASPGATDLSMPVASMRIAGSRPEQVLRVVQEDARRVSERYARASGPMRLVMDIVTTKELVSMEHTRRRLERASPDYTSLLLGFRVFGPSKAAALYAVEREAATRLSAMRGGARALGRVKPAAWGLGLRSTTLGKVPTVANVAGAIEEMRVPRGSLAGVSVFIMPFSLVGTSGLSWPNVVVIGSRPPDYETMDTQLQFTIAHEMGHIIHYRAMGPAGSPAWREYMRLRRIPNWQSGGRALTAAWETSVEESFAEDVRVVFGGTKSAQADYGTIYGDPRGQPGECDRLTAFILKQIAASKAEGREASVRAIFASASSSFM